MTQSPPTGELVEALARFGLDATDLDMLKSGDMLGSKTGAKWFDAITTLERELEEERALSERLKLEAQGHAMEARTANSTIYEIYQVLSGGRGEPGNWNGAEPARRYVTASQAEVERLKAALKLCQSALEMMVGPEAVRASTVMHAWAHGVEAEAAARAALQVEDSKG